MAIETTPQMVSNVYEQTRQRLAVVRKRYFNFMDDNMGPWEVRQVQTSIFYFTADLLGYGILDSCPHQLQMDQLRRDHHQDDDEGTKNQQAFDQQVDNFLRFAHDGFSNRINTFSAFCGELLQTYPIR